MTVGCPKLHREAALKALARTIHELEEDLEEDLVFACLDLLLVHKRFGRITRAGEGALARLVGNLTIHGGTQGLLDEAVKLRSPPANQG